MSHGSKHRRKEDDLKHLSKSNVFQRLGDSRSERKHQHEKYYESESKHEKMEEHRSKHDHIKKKSKLKNSLKDPMPGKIKAKKEVFVDEPVRHSTKLHRTYDDSEFPTESQHHGRSKQEGSRGHKRKVARSSSSSSVSPPRQVKHVTKRQRYQSPSPEPSYRPKDQERGRSRERRGKKQYESPDDLKQQSSKTPKHSHSQHSVAKKHVDRAISPDEAWSHEEEKRHKKFSTERKKTGHQIRREETYLDDSFSKRSKHSSHADDLSERSYSYEALRREEPVLYDKKHKQLKKEKVAYSSEDNTERDYRLQKKHRRSQELSEKQKNKKFVDRRDDRSTSSHYTEFSSNEQSSKTHASKKKRKDSLLQSPSPSPPRSITPIYHSKKNIARYSKHLQAASNDDASDVEGKHRTKVKKKKKHRISDADDVVDSHPSRIREQRFDEEEIVDDGRTKKNKKRKRVRDVESASVSRSESEDRLPKKQRISDREDEAVWKDRRRDRKVEEKMPPILRRSPGRPSPTPPLREKVLQRKRVETPESSSSRSTSYRRKLSPVSRNVAVLQRRADSSLERESFKPRLDDRRERREEPFHVRDSDADRRKPAKDLRMEDRRIRVDERPRERQANERPVYSDKTGRYTEKQQKLSYEEKLLLLKEHLNAEKRRPSHRVESEFTKRERPLVQLERRIDPPPVRRERVKSDWKAPVLEHSTKRSDFRDRKPPAIEPDRVHRVREIRTPPAFEEPARPRRVSPWVDNGAKPSSVSRDRNLSKERWAQVRRPIDDLIGDVRYKDGKGQSISRDRGQFGSKGKSPAPSGTYREVRRSGDHHSNRDLRLEVTIHDGGSRTSVDFDKMTKRKRHPSPTRMVAYDPPRSRDRPLHPPPPPVVQRSRSGSNPKRPETSRHQRDRPESYHQQRAHVSSIRNVSRDRPRSRDYQIKRDGQNASFRGDATKLQKRDKLHPQALNRDRSRVSTTSRSSTRSPRRLRRHSPLTPRGGRTDRQSSRSAKSTRGESKHSSERQKRSKEKKDETSSSVSANREKETTAEAADVLDVDWKGLAPEEKEKGTEEGNSGSVLSRFTPGNVLLRMGISSKLLPDYLLQRVAQKCSEVKSTESPSLVLEHGLGALNRSESLRRMSWLNNFSNMSSGTRMTSFSDASYRQRLLGINGDMRIPTFPPQIINARTYSASIKHYLNKTANKMPIEVQ